LEWSADGISDFLQKIEISSRKWRENKFPGLSGDKKRLSYGKKEVSSRKKEGEVNFLEGVGGVY